MYTLGYDLGSSSVKASILAVESGTAIKTVQSPKQEMVIAAPQLGWAEQDPDLWWQHIQLATQELLQATNIQATDIQAIGISYQMHGLVLIDQAQQVLRPSIIWCDSRAVAIGDRAFEAIGVTKSLSHLLNSPGNFTASKLKWVQENEPELYEKVDKFLLPGDYIAMKLTGEAQTTISGLSEGIFYDFQNQQVADFLMDHFGFAYSLIPDIVPTFGMQGELTATAAKALGLQEGTAVTYRAGDQPNNAYSLNVLQAGEVAATAGTSGVIYGVNEVPHYDAKSRVNIFAHVNHQAVAPKLGVLLCINGTGILYNWLRQNTAPDLSYEQMNALVHETPVGSDGLVIFPFGNGAERVLENKEIGGQIHHLNFNRHGRGHLFRAAQEGIAFSMKYGLEIMHSMGVDAKVMRAGHANMFLSPVFRQTLANVAGASIELYDTDGAQGAARAAGVGAGIYASFAESFQGLQLKEIIQPDSTAAACLEAYGRWGSKLLELV